MRSNKKQVDPRVQEEIKSRQEQADREYQQRLAQQYWPAEQQRRGQQIDEHTQALNAKALAAQQAADAKKAAEQAEWDRQRAALEQGRRRRPADISTRGDSQSPSPPSTRGGRSPMQRKPSIPRYPAAAPVPSAPEDGLLVPQSRRPSMARRPSLGLHQAAQAKKQQEDEDRFQERMRQQHAEWELRRAAEEEELRRLQASRAEEETRLKKQLQDEREAMMQDLLNERMQHKAQLEQQQRALDSALEAERARLTGMQEEASNQLHNLEAQQAMLASQVEQQNKLLEDQQRKADEDLCEQELAAEKDRCPHMQHRQPKSVATLSSKLRREREEAASQLRSLHEKTEEEEEKARRLAQDVEAQLQRQREEQEAELKRRQAEEEAHMQKEMAKMQQDLTTDLEQDLARRQAEARQQLQGVQDQLAAARATMHQEMAAADQEKRHTVEQEQERRRKEEADWKARLANWHQKQQEWKAQEEERRRWQDRQAQKWEKEKADSELQKQKLYDSLSLLLRVASVPFSSAVCTAADIAVQEKEADAARQRTRKALAEDQADLLDKIKGMEERLKQAESDLQAKRRHAEELARAAAAHDKQMQDSDWRNQRREEELRQKDAELAQKAKAHAREMDEQKKLLAMPAQELSEGHLKLTAMQAMEYLVHYLVHAKDRGERARASQSRDAAMQTIPKMSQDLLSALKMADVAMRQISTSDDKLKKMQKVVDKIASKGLAVPSQLSKAPISPRALGKSSGFILAVRVVASENNFAHHRKQMTQALKIFQTVLKREFLASKARSVKATERCFIAVVENAADALKLANNVQTAMLRLTWPKTILDLDGCHEERETSGMVIWSGPRLQIGIHQGKFMAQKDPEFAARTMFLGAAVGLTRRIASVGRPGETLVS
eukprot:gene3358-91_t